ncbi:RimK family alpha-L-glutamate ligase [Streptomyces sp. NPDC086783]|uniref:ATP-grasp domain-containing protein n=1 Tax=Streptomyces sp. NPDC086783 TaxID=3365758 RepID=UPI0037F292E8
MTSIAISSFHEDIHASVIADELRRHFGASVSIFGTDRFGRDTKGISWLQSAQEQPFATSTDGIGVDVHSLDVMWWRRTASGWLPENDEKELSPADREFIYLNSRMAWSGLLATEFRGIWVDNPTHIDLAANKIIQHCVARQAGFRIPQTLVSQDPDEIRAFYDTQNGEVIVKPLKQVKSVPALTKRVSKELLTNEASMKLCPVIYQELIPGSKHIRAHVFGDQVLAALLESDDLDWRPDLRIPCRQFVLPGQVQANLKNVLRQLNLSMGIFDLKLTDEGEYVWIEVNPQGQFLFIEGMCGLPLTRAMAAFLYHQATKNQPS